MTRRPLTSARTGQPALAAPGAIASQGACAVESPRTVIAAPLYNHAAYLESALDSLLSQADGDFALLLVDDLSNDDTSWIARRYLERDPRVSYHRSGTRLGLVGNWRRGFELARELYPRAEFFAWGSDHDLWHPRWLELMVAELEGHPEAVLAYPTSERITADGAVMHCRGGFHTVGVSDTAARVRRSYRDMHAGDMVYGLVRARAMERAGVFRAVLEPDRLLMAELAVQGEFRHVPRKLWRRRFVKSAVRSRQRRAIFPERRPLHSWLAPWLVKPTVFFWVYALRGAPTRVPGRWEGLKLAWAYAYATVEHVLHRRAARTRKGWARARKKLARARKRFVRPARRRAGHALRAIRRLPRRARKARQQPARAPDGADRWQLAQEPAEGESVAASQSSSSS